MGLLMGPQGSKNGHLKYWSCALKFLQVNHDAGVYYKVTEKATPLTNPEPTHNHVLFYYLRANAMSC